jgi:ribosomal protein S24E
MDGMEIHIKQRKDNPTLQREDFECLVNFQGPTPNKTAVKELVARALAANIDLLTINRMLQQFGLQQVMVYGSVFKTKEAMPKPKVKKEEKKAQ